MSSDIEGLGDVAAAALVGAALDKPGEPLDRTREGGEHCQNCGAALVGRYCAACGQPARVHRTIHGLVEELFHNLIHLDARVWRTLPLLVLRPGRLTYRYIHGQRATYVSPLALFLFIVFAMFFVFGLAGGPRFGLDEQTAATIAAEVAEDNREEVEAEADGEEGVAPDDGAEPGAPAAEDAGQAPAAADGAEADGADADAAASDGPEELNVAEAGQAALVQEAIRRAIAEGDLTEEEEQALSQTLERVQREAEEGGGFLDAISRSAESGDMDINTGNPALDARIRHNLANPELTLYRLQDAAYKYCFLLVPISLPFMWLIFAWKRGVTLFDHCVFVLYSLSFMALLFMTLALLGMAGGAVLGATFPWVLFAPPVHLAFQLKGAYRLRWFSAIWRTFAVLTAAFFALLIYLIGMGLLGLLG